MQSVNLMPAGYTQKERAKRRLIITSGAMVALVLAMVGLSKLMDKRTSEKTHANVILERQVGELEAAQADLASCNRRLWGLAEKLSVVRTLEHNRRWASCLARVAHAAGEEILLTRADIGPVRLKTDDSGSTAGGKAPARSTARRGRAAPEEPEKDLSRPQRLVLMLEGYALSNTDVYRFISALRATGTFGRVTFKGARAAQINAKQLSRFELECPIRYGTRKRGGAVIGPTKEDTAAPEGGPTLLSSAPAAPGTGARP